MSNNVISQELKNVQMVCAQEGYVMTSERLKKWERKVNQLVVLTEVTSDYFSKIGMVVPIEVADALGEQHKLLKEIGFEKPRNSEPSSPPKEEVCLPSMGSTPKKNACQESPEDTQQYESDLKECLDRIAFLELQLEQCKKAFHVVNERPIHLTEIPTKYSATNLSLGNANMTLAQAIHAATKLGFEISFSNGSIKNLSELSLTVSKPGNFTSYVIYFSPSLFHPQENSEFQDLEMVRSIEIGILKLGGKRLHEYQRKEEMPKV